jgi:hypothetical protein
MDQKRRPYQRWEEIFMLQDSMTNNASLTATQAIQTDVEKTLSFDPGTGKFTFDSFTPDSLGVFRIPLSTAQTIAINLGSGIAFAPKPFQALKFNNSGGFGGVTISPDSSPNRIEIPVASLPPASGMLGFVLIVQFNGPSATVQNIETPPFLITPDHQFPELELSLSYNPDTGVFNFTANGHPIPGKVTLEKGLIIFRRHDGVSSPPSGIDVFLDVPLSTGIVFSSSPVVPDSIPFTRHSGTHLTIDREFSSGTGFNVGFAVEVPVGENQTCTVLSPDPIIIDKQIGSDGG